MPTRWESERATAFAARHGLERRSQAIQRRQHLAEVDPATVRRLFDEAAAVATDYELVRVVGRTPPELVDAVTRMTAAINDAPNDDLDVEDEVFTPERLAAYEERGDRPRHPALPAGRPAPRRPASSRATP